MPANNKEIVAKVDAAFAANDMDAFLSFCADEIEWTIVGAESVKGKEKIRQWMKEKPMTEPPQFTAVGVIAEGDSVAAHGHMMMKDKAGNDVPHDYCDLYRFRDGKIVTLTSFVVKTEPQSKASAA